MCIKVTGHIFTMLVFTLAFNLHAVASDCAGSAQPSDTNLTPEGDTFAAFTVRPISCAEGCEGWVDYRIYYSGLNGQAHFYSNKVEWRSNRGEAVRVSDTGYESYCRADSLGPCRINHTEILSVSCDN